MQLPSVESSKFSVSKFLSTGDREPHREKVVSVESSKRCIFGFQGAWRPTATDQRLGL